MIERAPRRPAPPSALRRRLGLALIGLALAAAALLGLAFWIAESRVERESLAVLRMQDRQAAAPGSLARDFAARANRERKLVPLLAAALLLIAVLAWWASGWLSARTLAPVERLLEQIRALDPVRRGQRLDVDRDAELRAVAEALNAYMARLDDLVERERVFSAAASHELRTPLAVIAGAAELLRSGPDGEAPAIERIERAVTRAREDLEALLALSRGGAGDPGNWLRLDRYLPIWAAPYRAGGRRVNWDLRPTLLHAPAGPIALVFTNLLRNALRAARAVITVRLHDGVLEVDDDGPGLSPEALVKAFEPRFSQRDGGSGIGLYICRTLARDRGWEVDLENREPYGVRARLRFPRAALRRPNRGDAL